MEYYTALKRRTSWRRQHLRRGWMLRRRAGIEDGGRSREGLDRNRELVGQAENLFQPTMTQGSLTPFPRPQVICPSQPPSGVRRHGRVVGSWLQHCMILSIFLFIFKKVLKFLAMPTAHGQVLNLSHSCDDAKSLTCWATREIQTVCSLELCPCKPNIGIKWKLATVSFKNKSKQVLKITCSAYALRDFKNKN